MESILVSACLLGESVRYNGGDKRSDHQVLARWLREGRVVPVCPEVAGGLPVPRQPAEIARGSVASEVLAGSASVIDASGRDVSVHFVKGAQHALTNARARKVRIAVLKEGSPSCGTGYTYDGTFTATRVGSPGVTAALLLRAGVRVFSEHQFDQADALLAKLEAETQS